jgi:hypothetical protein
MNPRDGWGAAQMERAMKNETPFREYSRSDFIRAGVVAGVWVLLYALLAAHSSGRSSQTERMATAVAPASIAGEAAAALKLDRNRSGR